MPMGAGPCPPARVNFLSLAILVVFAPGRAPASASDDCWRSDWGGSGGCHACTDAAWVPPASYGGTNPVRHTRCITRNAAVELGASEDGGGLVVSVPLPAGKPVSQPKFHMQHVKVRVQPQPHAQPQLQCDERLGKAVLLQVPDLFNLYHSFFDLLAPILAAMVRAGPGATLLLAHDPVVTGAMPWLGPDFNLVAVARDWAAGDGAGGGGGAADLDSPNSSGGGAADPCGFGTSGSTGYQFAGYLQALSSTGYLRWLTPRSAAAVLEGDGTAQRLHLHCLGQLDLKGERVLLPALLPPLSASRLCVDELHMDVDTELSMWGLEQDLSIRAGTPCGSSTWAGLTAVDLPAPCLLRWASSLKHSRHCCAVPCRAVPCRAVPCRAMPACTPNVRHAIVSHTTIALLVGFAGFRNRPKHRAIFRQLFRETLMPAMLGGPAVAAAVHNTPPKLTLLLRGSGGVSRPTKSPEALERAVTAAAAAHARLCNGGGGSGGGGDSGGELHRALPVQTVDAAKLTLREQVVSKPSERASEPAGWLAGAGCHCMIAAAHQTAMPCVLPTAGFLLRRRSSLGRGSLSGTTVPGWPTWCGCGPAPGKLRCSRSRTRSVAGTAATTSGRLPG
eukprot:SAG22_NODE_588_length_8842_cov_33.853254_7_plen_617_part_00